MLLALKIYCWAYLIFTTLARVVNYDSTKKEHNVVRIIDNIVIFFFVIAIFIMSKCPF